MCWNQEEEPSAVDMWDNEDLNQSFTKEKEARFLRQRAGRMNMICVEQVAFSLASCER